MYQQFQKPNIQQLTNNDAIPVGQLNEETKN